VQKVLCRLRSLHRALSFGPSCVDMFTLAVSRGRLAAARYLLSEGLLKMPLPARQVADALRPKDEHPADTQKTGLLPADTPGPHGSASQSLVGSGNASMDLQRRR